VPVIGCGAGPACHGCVIVTHDGVGLTPTRPKFAPLLADLSAPHREAYAKYVRDVASGAYPAAEHNYPMRPEEAARLKQRLAEDEQGEDGQGE